MQKRFLFWDNPRDAVLTIVPLLMLLGAVNVFSASFVVAEAMFWACVPLVTPVSCVSYMLGNETRGILLKEQIELDTNQLLQLLNNELTYRKMAAEGQTWSQQFTTDAFEVEIKKLLGCQF